MKTIIFITLSVICLLAALTTAYFLATRTYFGADFIALLFITVIAIATSIIYAFMAYSVIKQNRLFDKAAQEQARSDWEYYERQLDAEMHMYAPEMRN